MKAKVFIAWKAKVHKYLFLRKGEMKMSYWKKALSIGLAAVMTASMLAGCGGSNKDTAQSGGNTAGTQASDTAEAADNGTSEDITTYKIATVRWTDAWPVDFLESGFMKELEEKHGIKIEWQVYYDNDWQEQKSLLLASGDLPDAFFGSICLKDTDISQNKDYFLELTDLIDQNMPNLKAVFEKEPELLARAKDRNGEIYSLVKKLPLRPEVCGNILYINKEWLDNLNLEVPTTYEELENVLEAFVTEDADGDGDPNNEFGITGNAGLYTLSGCLRNYLFPFGTMVSRDNNYMSLVDGKPVFMPVEENYKESVKWFSDMYQKGIIDPEFFTQEDAMRRSKLQAEGGSQVGLVSAWTADAETGLNVGQFVPLEAITGPDGKHHVENAQNFLDISDRELLITKNCQNPEKLLAWADDFYTDLASLQTFYGSIPDQIQDNGDGTYDVLVPSDGSSLDTSAWSNSMRDFGPKYMNPEFYDKVSLPADQGDGIKLAEDAINGKYIADDNVIGFPMVKYTDEELTQLTTLGTDIYKYVEAQFAHWVVDGGIDEEWDAYLKQLDSMGLQDLMNIQNGAYEAYLQSMGK